MKAIFFIIMMLSADAALCMDFSCSIYNSEDYASQSVSGDSITFDGYAYLDSESISLSGGGASTSPQSSFSYSLIFNDEPMQARAETDSGSLAWSGKAKVDYDASEAVVSSRSSVSDGNLTAGYRNGDVEVYSQVNTVGSKFQENARISPDLIFAKGSGITDTDNSANGSEISDPDSQEEEKKLLDQTLQVNGFGKQGEIASLIYGNSTFQWITKVNARDSGFSLGMDVAGRCSNESSLTALQMIGSATEFPTQRLPPGRIDVKKILEPEANFTIDEDFAQREIEEFNQDNSIDKCLNNWYRSEQTTYINLTGKSSEEGWNRESGLYFKMGMDFLVNRTA